MKILMLTLIFTASSIPMAYANKVGEQFEPQCEEPCEKCPGGIRKCDKTQSSGSRSIKSIDSNVKKSKNEKVRSSKQ